MKLPALKLLLMVVCLPVVCLAMPAGGSPPADGFVLTNVNILDVEQQRILASRQIHVLNGRILAVEAAGNLPNDGTVVIDGRGGYVTPGLIDMHVHMYEEAAFAIALSHGVTHVRIMTGIPAQLRWREQLDNGQLVGSSATVSSPIISAYDDAFLHHASHNADDVRRTIREYQSQGYDLIKAYGNLSEEVLVALADESRSLGIPVAKHGPHAAGSQSAAALAGFQSLEHVEDIFQGPLDYQFAPERLPAIVAEIKAADVPVTPTLNIFRQLTLLSAEKQDYLDRIPQDYTSSIIGLEARSNQVKRWLSASEELAAHNRRALAFLLEITRALHNAGVVLLVGSDSGVLLSPHGLATHTEMQLLNQAGLTPFEVLAAATINPARALGLGTEMGRVAPSFKADFIYTLADPTQELGVLQTPAAVVKNGQWYADADLVRIREEAIESRSLWAEIVALYEAISD